MTLRPPTRTVAENADGDTFATERFATPTGPRQSDPTAAEPGWWIGFEWATWGWVALCTVVVTFGLLWWAFGWALSMSLAMLAALVIVAIPSKGDA